MNVPRFLREHLKSAFAQESVKAMFDATTLECLEDFARAIYERVYQHHLAEFRNAADNGIAHELVVLTDTLRICCASGVQRDPGTPFTERDIRVAIAVSLLHDVFVVPKILEVGKKVDDAESQRQRTDNRDAHMAGGAKYARRILAGLPHEVDRERVEHLISHHDDVKCGRAYPPTEDWLAVCCFEGDSLWVVHALGLIADLHRDAVQDGAGGLQSSPVSAKALQKRAAQNYESILKRYRQFLPDDERYQDDATIFRTREAYKILKERLGDWGIPLG